MKTRKRRHFGSKLDFRSITCAPINELGVVYLFGVLHEAFDFKVESIQAGFPDCIARRRIDNERWEELRIEFEFRSKSFVVHKHNPDEVDIIVCWEHNWPGCPEHIEIIELSSLIGNVEAINEEIKKPAELSAYNQFCQQKRREGLSFSEIAALWRKAKIKTEKPPVNTQKLSGWQRFCQQKRSEGVEFEEIARLWQERSED